ncbi:hypothetical protein [Enterovibrio paralichthyis]|nr:hypothetical protein [Enterovibrio paralichthyis]MBV7297064.1 hypothetical protein [Enterovibrio paralichthyis]
MAIFAAFMQALLIIDTAFPPITGIGRKQGTFWLKKHLTAVLIVGFRGN